MVGRRPIPTGATVTPPASPTDGFEQDAKIGDTLEQIDRLTAAQYSDRFAAAAARHGGGHRRLANGAVVATFGSPVAPRIAIMSGLHGDERSGPIALLHWLETTPAGAVAPADAQVWVAPLVNDVGWNENTREWTALNLNRAFLPGVAPPFLAQLMAELSERVPRLYLDLHEDSTRDYAYVYRYTEDSHGLAERFQAELAAAALTWTPASLSQWKGSSEVFVRRLGCDRCVTLEVPPVWPLARRVGWYLRALAFGLSFQD